MDEWRSMTHAEQEHQWRLLLEKEYRLRANLKEGSPASDLREWWREVARVFGRLRISQLPAPDPLPIGLFYAMYGFAGHLAVGDMPDAIRGAITPGQTSPTPMERRDIQMAVTYRKAVKMGIIKDGHPTQTIKRVYGVKSDRAIQEWYRKYEPLSGYLDIENQDEAVTVIENHFHANGSSYKVRNSRTKKTTPGGKKV